MTKAISGNYTHYGQATQPDLEIAIRHLEESFSVIGLAERFDESLIMMKRAFRWRFPYYLNENVTENRPSRESISAEIRHQIEGINQLDLQLYDYAKARHERQIELAGPQFGQEVDSFRRWNRPVAGLHKLVRNVKFTFFPPSENTPLDKPRKR
jgi:hypothetical protein